MPLTINIELSDRDLEHFNRAIELARKAAGDKSNQEIIDGAVTLLETEREAERRGLSPEAVGRADWLAARREELQDRMHRRRAREAGSGKGVGYGSSTGYASTRRSYVATGWRPGVFKLR